MEKNKKEGLSIYFCGEEQCPAGHFFGPAVRPHYLLHVILNGKGIYKTKTRTYTLKAGDAFLISPMESTYYQADETEPWQYVWVGFDGLDVNTILSQTCFYSSPVYVNDTENKAIQHQASELIRTFRSPDHNPLTLQAYFYLLLSMMEGSVQASPEEFSGIYLQKALDYMQNNYSYPIRIADIASYIGIDRTYLYRLFIQEEQLSPKQYLLQLRLRTAAGMLSQSQYTITEIAYSCGFKDTAAFCNQFKKAFSYTPRRFRDIVREEHRNHNI